MSYNPGGSGSGSIAGSSDVALSNPTNTQVLTYDSSVAKWENKPGAVAGSTTGTFTAGDDQRIDAIAYGLDYTGANAAANTAILTGLLANYNIIGIPAAPASASGYIALSTTLELTGKSQWLIGLGGGPVNQQGVVSGVGLQIIPGTGFSAGSYSAPVVISSQYGGLRNVTIMGQNANASVTTSYACVLNASQITLAECGFLFGSDTSLYDSGNSNQANLWHCVGRNPAAYSLKNNSQDWLVTNWRSLGTRSFAGGGTNVIGGHFTGGAPHNTEINAPINFNGVYFDSVYQSGVGTALISSTYSGTAPTSLTGCKYYNNSAGQNIDLFSQTGNAGLVVNGGSVTGVNGNSFKALMNGSSGNGDQLRGLTIDAGIMQTDTVAAYFPGGAPNGGYDFYVYNGSGHHSSTLDASNQLLVVSDTALTASTNNIILTSANLSVGLYRLSATLTMSGVTTPGNIDVGFTTSGTVNGLNSTTVRATASNPFQASLAAEVKVTAAGTISLVAYPDSAVVGATVKASPVAGSTFNGASSFSWTKIG